MIVNGNLNDPSGDQMAADSEESDSCSSSDALDEEVDNDVSFKSNNNTLDESLVFLEGTNMPKGVGDLKSSKDEVQRSAETDFDGEIELIDGEESENDQDHIKPCVGIGPRSICRGEKLKPLVPSYLYDNESSQYLGAKQEPMIGREWIFKDIEKVIFNF